MRGKKIFIVLIVLIAFAIPVGFFILTTMASSPKPVTIVAPKTITTEKTNFYINSLLIDMSQKEKLTLSYLDQDRIKRCIVTGTRDKKKMEEILQQAIVWAGNSQELKVSTMEIKKRITARSKM